MQNECPVALRVGDRVLVIALPVPSAPHLPWLRTTSRRMDQETSTSRHRHESPRCEDDVRSVQTSGTVIGIEPEMLDVALSQGDGAPQPVPRPSRRPAAVVLGAVAGEPPRADMGRVPELAGSGAPLHIVAAVDQHRGAARLPIAYTWMGLQQRDHPSWEWKTPGEAVQRVSWQEAISIVCADSIAASLSEGVLLSDATACITTPNSLDLDAQENSTARGDCAVPQRHALVASSRGLLSRGSTATEKSYIQLTHMLLMNPLVVFSSWIWGWLHSR